jgi:hypothetical protein
MEDLKTISDRVTRIGKNELLYLLIDAFNIMGGMGFQKKYVRNTIPGIYVIYIRHGIRKKRVLILVSRGITNCLDPEISIYHQRGWKNIKLRESEFQFLEDHFKKDINN